VTRAELARRGALALGLLTATGGLLVGSGRASVPTATARLGDLVDAVELRGAVQPVHSALLNAPSTLPGDTTIVRIAANGTNVKAGDVVAVLDPSKLENALTQAHGDLARLDGEIERAQVDAVALEKQDGAAAASAAREVERARFEMRKVDILSPIAAEQNRLRLADAEQTQREVEERMASGRTARAADLESRRQVRARLQRQVERAQEAITALTIVAPADGLVVLRTNPRVRSAAGAMQEYKAGDTVWAGAALAELPDLSNMRVQAQVDEIDRARVHAGQAATVRVDALPDRELPATLTDVGSVARPDFTQMPPGKGFDVTLAPTTSDPRLRPGMGASVRITIAHKGRALLIPASAVTWRQGHAFVRVASVFRLTEREIRVARRGAVEVAVSDGLREGERVALSPPPDAGRAWAVSAPGMPR
jgi:multidrug efflux pump subunit AcrA (membrane-fusion protein)